MIEVISVEEREKWDEIVRSISGYDVSYLNSYAKAFKIQGEGEPVLIHYKDEDTSAINVIMIRDIAKVEAYKDILPENEWLDISTPYGYGGFISNNGKYKKIDEEYLEYCKDKGFVSEFVRFNLFSNYKDGFNGKVEKCNENIIRTLDLSIDEMMMDFEHKVRKNIKKALKAGLQIKLDYSAESLDDFLKIYYSTMDRNSADNRYYFSREFFKEINRMQNNYIYVYTLHNDKIISDELVLYGEENCYSFLGGTDINYYELRPNDFLKYSIIMWAKEKGLKRYIIGGGYKENDGIFKYKKSFAPNGGRDFYIGKRILDKQRYNKLLEISLNNEENREKANFFPEYR